jgi:hypothetical protein
MPDFRCSTKGLSTARNGMKFDRADTVSNISMRFFSFRSDRDDFEKAIGNPKSAGAL